MNLEEVKTRATITVPEAGELLGLGRDAAYAAARKGEIPTLKIGRRLLVPVPELLAMLGATKTEGGKSPAEVMAEELSAAVDWQEAVRLLLRKADARVERYREMYGLLAGPTAVREQRHFTGMSMADADLIAKRRRDGL
jgi:excisionase family DNA binding protein